MEENESVLTEEEKAEKKRKSGNRIFGFLLTIAIILLSGLVYEIVTLIMNH